MSSTQTATPGSPASWPPAIRARYGIGQRRWRPLVFALLGVGFAIAVAVLGWRVSTPAVKGAVAAYVTVSDDRMDLTLEVQRRTDEPISCAIRARASDGFDVGYAVLDLPGGPGMSRTDYRMATAYRALVGELLGCAVGQLPDSVTGAQFRPGVLPPSQPWRPQDAAPTTP